MIAPTSSRYFKVEPYEAIVIGDRVVSRESTIAKKEVRWRIVSIAGKDAVGINIVAVDGIPAEDLAQIMCEAANNARSKRK